MHKSSFIKEYQGWIIKCGGTIAVVVLFLFMILPKSKLMNLLWMIAASFNPGNPEQIRIKVYVTVIVISLFIAGLTMAFIHLIQKLVDDSF